MIWISWNSLESKKYYINCVKFDLEGIDFIKYFKIVIFMFILDKSKSRMEFSQLA